MPAAKGRAGARPTKAEAKPTKRAAQRAAAPPTKARTSRSPRTLATGGAAGKGTKQKVKQPSSTFSRPAPPGATATPLYKELDAHLRRLFPGITAGEAYGMRGWTARRAKRIGTWPGTMDPNTIWVGLAQRPAGTTLHLWNPFEFGIIRRYEKALKAVGAKPMVGCIRYERKGAFPLSAVLPILEDVAAAARHEAAVVNKGQA